MSEFKNKFIEIFNKCNILTDSSDTSLEVNFLDLNLKIFDYINNKIQIILDENLSCEHTLEYNYILSSKVSSDNDIKNYINEIYNFIYNKMIEHIDEELLEHDKIYLNMFVYSITIGKNFIRFKGNFKFK